MQLRSILSRDVYALRLDLRTRLVAVNRHPAAKFFPATVGLNLPTVRTQGFSSGRLLAFPELRQQTSSDKSLKSAKPTGDHTLAKQAPKGPEPKPEAAVATGAKPADEKVIVRDGAAIPAKSEDTTTPEAPPAKKSLWEKVKAEAHHYWNGTKLLGYEIKVSTKLALKLASGRELTRREDRQFRRTISDIIRLVPFAMFVVIPFAELLLPVALKIFPNLLPSTYESSSSKEKKLKSLSAARLNLSEYIQKDISKVKFTMPTLNDEHQQHQFEEFFSKVRQGESPSRDLMLTVARLFKDDSILDNLERPQLVTLAKYMNLQPFGTNIMLRYSIRHRMRIIKQDDRIIEYEGIDSLNIIELQNACQSRGFRTVDVSPGRLRDDLSNWLQLRLHDRVPSTLLILGSAFSYGKHDLDSLYDGVLNVLGALPPEVYHEAKIEVSKDKVTNADRLEYVKEQQELIQDEQKEEEDSGHVIPVRDNLNVDDDHQQSASASASGPSEPSEPVPTESEEVAKADQHFYAKGAKPSTPDATISEQDAKADEAYYNQKPKPEPTISEEDAKADEAYYYQKPKPEPTISEEDAKADEAYYYQKPKPEPTLSEQDAKADEAYYNQKRKQ